MPDDIFRGRGVEVTLAKADNFLLIKETLTRIGIASKRENVLTQSCHLLHKQGRYVIIHFKELLEMDGREVDFSEEDEGRCNTIASLLEDWGLLTIVDKERSASPKANMSQIKILPHSEKQDWILKSKYTVGKKRT
jgi:hypothetical protein